MTFERMRAVADAVLLEGYVLYPYRASSTKNRFRWAFGVLVPRGHSEGPAGTDPWWLESQCLIEATKATEVELRLRFLQLRRRSIEVFDEGTFRAVHGLEVAGHLYVPWDEGEVREIALPALTLEDCAGEGQSSEFEVAGGQDRSLLHEGDGRLRGRVVRTSASIRGRLRVSAAPVEGARGLSRLAVRVENVTPMGDVCVARDQALPLACLSTHLMLSVERGAFLSLIDPPEWAKAAAARCRNVGTFPVLAGEEGRRDLLLAAPIILYDHPAVAPESHGDFFDATEIDELLTLRTATLTEDERREVRATDARGAAILDRVDALPPEAIARLHGAIRERATDDAVAGTGAGPAAEQPSARALRPGDRVRLRPGARRTDAQDLLYAGMSATVQKVMWDVDGQPCVAVTVDDDPATDLHLWHGRFHYYYPDELEPLPEEKAG